MTRIIKQWIEKADHDLGTAINYAEEFRELILGKMDLQKPQ